MLFWDILSLSGGWSWNQRFHLNQAGGCRKAAAVTGSSSSSLSPSSSVSIPLWEHRPSISPAFPSLPGIVGTLGSGLAPVRYENPALGLLGKEGPLRTLAQIVPGSTHSLCFCASRLTLIWPQTTPAWYLVPRLS